MYNIQNTPSLKNPFGVSLDTIEEAFDDGADYTIQPDTLKAPNGADSKIITLQAFKSKNEMFGERLVQMELYHPDITFGDLAASANYESQFELEGLSPSILDVGEIIVDEIRLPYLVRDDYTHEFNSPGPREYFQCLLEFLEKVGQGPRHDAFQVGEYSHGFIAPNAVKAQSGDQILVTGLNLHWLFKLSGKLTDSQWEFLPWPKLPADDLNMGLLVPARDMRDIGLVSEADTG